MDKIMHGVKRFLQVEKHIKATKAFNTGVSANNGLMKIARNIWGLEPPGKKECGHRFEECERENRKDGHGRPEGYTLDDRGGRDTGFRTKRMRRCSQEDGGRLKSTNVLMSDSDLLTGPSEREARRLEERTQRMIAPSMTEGSRPVCTRLEKLKKRSCSICCSNKAKRNQNQAVGHEGWVANLIHMRSHSQESLVEVIVKDHQESPNLKPTFPVPPNTPELDKDQLPSGLSSIGSRTSNADDFDVAPFGLATKSHIQQFLRTMNSSPAEVTRFSISEDSNNDEQEHSSQLVIAPDDHISELDLPPSEDPVLDSSTRPDLDAAFKEAMETPLPLPDCSTFRTSATPYYKSQVNASRKLPEIPELPELLTTKSSTPARPSFSISSASSNLDPTLSLLVEQTIAKPLISIASTSSNADPPLSLLVEKSHCCCLGSSYHDIEKEDLQSSSSLLRETPLFDYPPLDSSATASQFGFEPTCNLMPGSWRESPSLPPEENGKYDGGRKSWKDILSTFIPLAPPFTQLFQFQSSITNEIPKVSVPETRLSLEEQRSLSPSSLRSERRCSFEDRRPFSPFSSPPPGITAGGSNNLHLRGGGPPSRFGFFRPWGAGKIEGNATRGRKLLDQKISTADSYFVGGWGEGKTWREFGGKMEKRCEEGYKVEKERREKEESEISRWESFVLFLAVLASGPKKRAELVGAELEVVSAEV